MDHLERASKVIETLLEAENTAWESYNTRAMALASLSAITASIVIGLGTSGALDDSRLGALFFVLGSCALFGSLACSLVALWPRPSSLQASSRDDFVRKISETEHQSDLELLQDYIEVSAQWVKQNAEAVTLKRLWVKRAYLFLGAGIGFLALQAVVVALDKA